jgi:hypothetical protein
LRPLRVLMRRRNPVIFRYFFAEFLRLIFIVPDPFRQETVNPWLPGRGASIGRISSSV